MGRHSSGRGFVRSIFSWFFHSVFWYLLIAACAGVFVWIAIDYFGRSDDGRSVAQETETEEEPSRTPTPERSVTPSPTPSPSPTEREPERERKLITKGVTVQVLNGTNDPEAADQMAVKLASLGYEIVALEFTSTPYKETTVFWAVPEAEKSARALADRFGWISDPKPGNLADTVSLHVVVGRDET